MVCESKTVYRIAVLGLSEAWKAKDNVFEVDFSRN
jgi:hypothetical protein